MSVVTDYLNPIGYVDVFDLFINTFNNFYTLQDDEYFLDIIDNEDRSIVGNKLVIISSNNNVELKSNGIIKKIIDISFSKNEHNDINISLSFVDSVSMYDSSDEPVQFVVGDIIYPSYYEDELYFDNCLKNIIKASHFENIYNINDCGYIKLLRNHNTNRVIYEYLHKYEKPLIANYVNQVNYNYLCITNMSHISIYRYINTNTKNKCFEIDWYDKIQKSVGIFLNGQNNVIGFKYHKSDTNYTETYENLCGNYELRKIPNIDDFILGYIPPIEQNYDDFCRLEIDNNEIIISHTIINNIIDSVFINDKNNCIRVFMKFYGVENIKVSMTIETYDDKKSTNISAAIIYHNEEHLEKIVTKYDDEPEKLIYMKNNIS